MKKILLIVFIGLGIFWIFFRDQDESNQDLEQVQEEFDPNSDVNDYKPPPPINPNQINLSQSTKNNPLAQELLKNINGDVLDFIGKNQDRISQFKPVAIQMVREIILCMKQNLCGEKNKENEGYFDENRTLHQQTLAGLLSFLDEVNRSYGMGNEELSKEELYSLLEIRNSEVQVMAARLAIQGADAEGSVSKLLTKVPFLLDSSISQMAQLTDEISRQSANLRGKWVEAISDWLRFERNSPDIFTSELALLNLNQEEFDQIFDSLCRYSKGKDNSDFYALIRLRFSEYANTQKLIFDSATHCK